MGESNEKTESELTLEMVKRRRAVKDVVDVDEQTGKIVVFFVGGKRYAFFGVNVREIITDGEIFWIPALPPYLPGLINVRGDIESVVDIGYFLGETPAAKASSERFILLMSFGEIRFGVKVDNIDDVIDIPLSAIEPPLPTLNETAGALVWGEIRLGEETVTLLGMEKLCGLVQL